MSVKYGMCRCGCGEKTEMASRTRPESGLIKGQPCRFLPGHNSQWRFMPPGERFEQYVYPDPNSGCFIWAGGCSDKGYGEFRFRGTTVLAHRVAWILAGRELPDRVPLLHKCDTPSCVNPDHLRLGTIRENNEEMARKGRGRRGSLPYGVKRQRSGGFGARLTIKKCVHWLGTYPTAEIAHSVVLEAHRKFYGVDL